MSRYDVAISIRRNSHSVTRSNNIDGRGATGGLSASAVDGQVSRAGGHPKTCRTAGKPAVAPEGKHRTQLPKPTASPSQSTCKQSVWHPCPNNVAGNDYSRPYVRKVSANARSCDSSSGVIGNRSSPLSRPSIFIAALIGIGLVAIRAYRGRAEIAYSATARASVISPASNALTWH